MGEKNCQSLCRRHWRNAAPERVFRLPACRGPAHRLRQRPGSARANRGRPYLSVPDKMQLAPEGGFTSFPYSIARYVTAPEEIYGRSPAMTALADIKMLNEMSKTDIRAVHKLVDPPILLHDDGILGGGATTIRMQPGA